MSTPSPLRIWIAALGGSVLALGLAAEAAPQVVSRSGGMQGPGGMQSAGPRVATGGRGAAQERLVGVPVGVDVQALAASVGAQVTGTFGPENAPLYLGGPGSVAQLSWTSGGAAQAGTAELLSGQLVSFAERNNDLRSPEVAACAIVAPVGSEQCTAGFVDGTPTQGEFDAQPLLPAVGADTLAPPVGSSAVVAIIDTGIDPLHPLFAGRIYGPGYDFLLDVPGGYDLANNIDDDGDGLIDEGFGHGTHVAGLACAMDPNVMILPYRVLDSEGSGDTFDVARAIHRAIAEGAECINLSLGTAAPSQAIYSAILVAHDHNVEVVTSAGNLAGPHLDPLALAEEVIAVAAVDHLGVLAPFASYGDEVDLVAPGVNLYSAYPGNRYAWWSGSSMSCAVVSGAMSRLRAQQVGTDVSDASGALEESAVNVDALNSVGNDNLGKGFIRLDLAAQVL